MTAYLGNASVRRRDLLEIIWRLDGEQTGTVVAYWKTPDARLAYEEFVLDRTVDWAALPTTVVAIVQQADDPRGQWATDQ